MKKLQFISAITSLLITMPLMAQTTLIKNVNGYTLSGDTLMKFSAISFTNDTINKTYKAPLYVLELKTHYIFILAAIKCVTYLIYILIIVTSGNLRK